MIWKCWILILRFIHVPACVVVLTNKDTSAMFVLRINPLRIELVGLTKVLPKVLSGGTNPQEI